MTDQLDSSQSPDVLDELVRELLEIGGVLSQIIRRMVEFDASGRSAPDAVPIPEMAHVLIRDVIGEVRKEYSKRDIRVAARIIGHATEAITENIFFVGPELN
jgi:hypothetical protein